MSIASAPYYWLTCDGTTTDGGTCSAKSTEGGEYAAWSDAGQAVTDAESCDWIEHEGKHYCDGCAEHFKCAECYELTEECTCEPEVTK